MIIASKDNSTVKRFGKLHDRKERDKSGKYLIEGYRAVKDSLPYIGGAELLLSESASEKFSAEFSEFDSAVCTDRIFSSVSDTETSQGVLCIADKKLSEQNYEAKYALFLDRIRDPGNMGTIIRTALAVGFNEIYCLDCVDPYNPKVVRSAMSAVSRVNLHLVEEEELSRLKENGYTIICADMGGQSVFDCEAAPQKICLIVGNEANGVSEDIITMSDIVPACMIGQ